MIEHLQKAAASRVVVLSAARLLDDEKFPAFDSIAEITARLVGAEAAFVSLIAEDRHIFAGASIGATATSRRPDLPMCNSICSLVVESEQSLEIADTRIDPRLQASQIAAAESLVAYLGVPLRLESGEVVGALCAVQGTPREWTTDDHGWLERMARTVVTEIHARRQAVALEVSVLERRRAARLVPARDLSELERRDAELHLLRTAISRLNDIVLITEAEPIDDTGPRVVFVNEAFERRTGYALAEIIGKTPRILQGPKTDREALDRIRKSLVEWRPVREELINYTKSGEEFWLELDIVPVANDDGWNTHWIAIERDITARKLLESERAQGQRLEAIGQFSGGIAHDFANLTTVIGASAELLRGQVPEAGAEEVEAILAATDRARSLVGQILAFSRQQVLHLRDLSLPAIVRQTDILLRRLVEGSIRLELTLPEHEIMVLADETQIVQVLLNLASNARDAMRHGGVLRISVEQVEDPGGPVGRLRVADEGGGIAPEHLKVIFEPFFTTKPLGRGTGLGLSTAYGIVQQLGGEMRVRSTLGAGTVFEIDLPVIQRNDGEPHTVTQGRSPVDLDARLRGLRVLLAEDEDALRRATQRLLQRRGVAVDTAANGLEALQRFRAAEQPYHLILTDLMMPGLGGAGLAHAIFELDPSMPVLLMSGWDADTAIGDLAGRVPVVGHLQKPFEPEVLLHAVFAAARVPAPSGSP
jgi:PAS domain S-box-containing protein